MFVISTERLPRLLALTRAVKVCKSDNISETWHYREVLIPNYFDTSRSFTDCRAFYSAIIRTLGQQLVLYLALLSCSLRTV